MWLEMVFKETLYKIIVMKWIWCFRFYAKLSIVKDKINL